MSFEDYYRSNVTYISQLDRRLELMRDTVVGLSPRSTLDVGCGRGFFLSQLAAAGLDELAGLDVFEDSEAVGWNRLVGDVTTTWPVPDGAFECVVAGEIIEHVPNPDHFLREARRVLVPGGTLLISTPNMVSWANRILVPLGVQPLGTETSSEIALGRRYRVLGQGNQVQGHLKVFTHRALGEILERYGFQVIDRRGVPAFFPRPVHLIDRAMARVVPLASGLVFVARSPRGQWPEPPAGRRHDILGE